MTKELKAVCYGEVLWDVFPNSEKIGGAPLNVALRLKSNGIETEIISKVGEDKKGKEILDYLNRNSVGTKNIAVDASFPTGRVNVDLDSKGSASYEIAYPSAWDKIELSPELLGTTENCDAFIFGSLVTRDEISRNSLLKLLGKASFKVFDVNLRPPHYEKEILRKLMQRADFIKFNDEELFEIASLLGSPFNSLEQNLHFVAEETSTQSICITKGYHGAVFLQNKNLYYNSGFKTDVKDTVGAGDSFLASLIAKLLDQEEPQFALDFACAVGAMVAGSEGANPLLREKDIKNFMFPGA